MGIKSDQGELNIRTRGLLYFKKKKHTYIYISIKNAIISKLQNQSLQKRLQNFLQLKSSIK